MPTNDEGEAVGLKSLGSVLGVFALLLSAGATAGVAIYKAGTAVERIEAHKDLPGHAVVASDVKHLQKNLVTVERHLEAIQQQADKNERNQIRICTAVGANCEP
tara:strand:- start:419 stop:730 length:312 start_codon:yes stop_codon:yes gene_type:complete